MIVRIKLAFGEQALLRLANGFLVPENVIEIRNNPKLPTLYESGMRYARERVETWCDYLSALAQGVEDCDALSAMRAADLVARPRQALQPGDDGFREYVAAGRPASLRAEVMMTTRVPRGSSGTYHCVTRYMINGTWYRDDPSARLGMYDRRRR